MLAKNLSAIFDNANVYNLERLDKPCTAVGLEPMNIVISVSTSSSNNRNIM